MLRQKALFSKILFLSNILIHSCIILYIVEKTFLPLFFTSIQYKKEILNQHIKGCFKINGKTKTTMPKKGEYVKYKKL